jgi:4-hydroxy-4-methyl-2-oxoglutarate aldolase
MIEEALPLVFAPPAGCPRGELVAKFRDVPTGHIVEAIGGAGALDWRIKPIASGAFIGVALTCECGASDNLALVATLAENAVKACRFHV